MISAAKGPGWPKAPRPSSFCGMGNPDLMGKFMEAFWKAQAKASQQDVEEIKRAGMSDRLAGQEKEDRREETEKFTF